jgi:hypothetical protein
MNKPSASLLETTNRIDQILSEYTDGYLLIGFHPITQEPMLVARTINVKTAIALNALLDGLINKHGGLVHPNAAE